MPHTHKLSIPVFDLHCDLLSYLVEIPGARFSKGIDIGAALPHLQAGGVKLQVMAIYSDVRPGSATKAWRQAQRYCRLLKDWGDYLLAVKSGEQLRQLSTSDKIGTMVAIENAAGLCEEDEPLDKCFERLEAIVQKAGPVLYIGLTHHTENRFGGGNYSQAGLKDDGKVLLDYLHGKNIAIDLAHTSDALAADIFDYTARRNLSIPLLASHSNFRKVCDHVRNLPDEFARELVQRQGLIGINFLRAYVDNHRPEALLDHFGWGMQLGAANALCFGADFFYTKDFPDKSRHPFYFAEHENAARYPDILLGLQAQGLGIPELRKISYENAYRFIGSLLPD